MSEDLKTEEFAKAFLAPHLVRKGYANPLIDSGAPMVGFRGRKAITTHANTTAMVVHWDPQSSATSGQMHAIAIECTSEGTPNTAAPVTRIPVGPRLNELFSSVGVMGACVSVANTSAADDRGGSYTGALIEDTDQFRMGKLTGSDIANLAGDNILMGYVGSDGMVVQCPTSHGGTRQMSIHDDYGASSNARLNDVNSSSLSTRSITTQRVGTAATGAFDTGSGRGVNSEAFMWDSNLLSSPTGGFESFVFPNNCYAITIGGHMDIEAGAGTTITGVRGVLYLYDEAGSLIPTSSNIGQEYRLFGGEVDLATGVSDVFTFTNRTIKTDVPIARAYIGVYVTAASGTFNSNTMVVNMSTHTLEPIYNPRDAVILITGIKGGNSIAVAASASVAGRFNASQALAVPTVRYEHSKPELDALVHSTIYSLLTKPISLGANYPRLAAAATTAMLTAMDDESEDAAFGFKKFKKLGKKLLHAAEKATEVGDMLGVPGVGAVGSALRSVEEGVQHAKAAHDALKKAKPGEIADMTRRAAKLML